MEAIKINPKINLKIILDLRNMTLPLKEEWIKTIEKFRKQPKQTINGIEVSFEVVGWGDGLNVPRHIGI